MNNADGLTQQFFHLAPIMMRQMKQHIQTASAGKLTHPQYRIMANIHRGMNTVSAIAVNHGVSQPSMSKMIDLMVRKKWLVRRLDLNDRRQAHLHLSRAGKKLFTEVRLQAQKQLAVRFEKLPAKELSQLENLLSSLTIILLKHLENE